MGSSFDDSDGDSYSLSDICVPTCARTFTHFSGLAVALWSRQYWLHLQVGKQVQGGWILLRSSAVVSGGGILLWIQVCWLWLCSQCSLWHHIACPGVHQVCGLEAVASWKGKEHRGRGIALRCVSLVLSCFFAINCLAYQGVRSSLFILFFSFQ